ncbi:MAG: prepilin-type N-terminal cleavage/methylation domain-containing protein [Nitrospirales bacterium]|nr:prepilin-type N-terminal cleavage/methylation domain-containing protein [Nitrospirales bacterium]
MATIRSETGYTMLEVLISAALGTIVLAGAFDVYVSSTKSLIGQANNVQKQADAKLAMDYMVREVRMAVTAFTPLNMAITAPNTITFPRAEVSGNASSGTLTTLTDTKQAWTVNRFAPTADGSRYFVRIFTGFPGAGAGHQIVTNTATRLTLTGAGFLIAPDNTSLYFIYRMKTFTLFADGTLFSLQYNNGGTNHLLAKNVTRLMFSDIAACDPAGTTVVPAGTVCISLTTQSAVADPVTLLDRQTGRIPSTHTLTSIVRPRN